MLIRKQIQEIQSYIEDTSNIKGSASLLYIPRNKEEVAEAIKQLSLKKIPFTISGGRTGTTGGCVPEQGAIISLEKLNSIVSIDGRFVKAQAAVTLEVLEKEINKSKLSFRAAPTESLATIGGVVNTCACGVRGFGYGSIRKYVCELEVILTDGQILTIRRGEIKAKGRRFDFNYNGQHYIFDLPTYNLPKVKSQAGYFIQNDMDLIDLFIGSEGTLGVVTSCILELQDIPLVVFDGLVFFQHQDKAIDFVERVKKLKVDKILNPISLEFFDVNTIEFLTKEYNFIPKSSSAVYFEQEALNQEQANQLLEYWQDLIDSSGALVDNSILAESPAERKKVFEFRHKVPQLINEFLRKHNQVKVSSDIAVSDSNFIEMYRFYNKLAEQSNIHYVNFGHIGQSHLHFNFLPVDDEQQRRAREYMIKFAQKALALNGTISAEHGIGKIKKSYLRMMYNKEDLLAMAALKKYFDQQCLLGLDNIFDKELLEQV